MTGFLKTHISDHYLIFHAHKDSNRIIDKQYRVKRNLSEKNKYLFKKTLKMDGITYLTMEMHSWHTGVQYENEN